AARLDLGTSRRGLLGRCGRGGRGSSDHRARLASSDSPCISGPRICRLSKLAAAQVGRSLRGLARVVACALASTSRACRVLVRVVVVGGRKRLVVWVQGMIWIAILVTYARAGWVGLGVGLLVSAFLLPYRRWARLVYVGAIFAILAAAAQNTIVRSQVYEL